MDICWRPLTSATLSTLDNECVNNHVHRVLIDGVYPTERRLSCEPVSR